MLAKTPRVMQHPAAVERHDERKPIRKVDLRGRVTERARMLFGWQVQSKAQGQRGDRARRERLRRDDAQALAHETIRAERAAVLCKRVQRETILPEVRFDGHDDL